MGSGSGPFLPGCFGKLPTAADFISHHARDTEALALEHWLQEGVATARNRFGSRTDMLLDGIPETHFVYWTRRAEEAIVGLLAPGRDRSGRRFPFTLFLQRGGGGGEAFAAYPVLFGPYFHEAAEILRTEWESIQDLFGRVDASGRSSPAVEGLLRSTPTALLAGTSAGIFGKTLLTEMVNFLALAKEYASRPEPPQFGLRFCLPPGAPEFDLAACFWLAAVARGFGEHGLTPIAFWSGTSPGGTEGRMDLYFQKPGVLAFLHLLDAGLSSDSLYPLIEGSEAGHPSSDPNVEALERLILPSATLGDVLDTILPERGESLG